MLKNSISTCLDSVLDFFDSDLFTVLALRDRLLLARVSGGQLNRYLELIPFRQLKAANSG